MHIVIISAVVTAVNTSNNTYIQKSEIYTEQKYIHSYTEICTEICTCVYIIFFFTIFSFEYGLEKFAFLIQKIKIKMCSYSGVVYMNIYIKINVNENLLVF